MMSQNIVRVDVDKGFSPASWDREIRSQAEKGLKALSTGMVDHPLHTIIRGAP